MSEVTPIPIPAPLHDGNVYVPEGDCGHERLCQQCNEREKPGPTQERDHSGYAILTGLYFVDASTGRRKPFLACSEDQNGGGWFVEEDEVAAGEVECHLGGVSVSRHDGLSARHRVISIEEALERRCLDVSEGVISFFWEDVLLEMLRARRETSGRDLAEAPSSAVTDTIREPGPH